jgi:hypothetical protein
MNALTSLNQLFLMAYWDKAKEPIADERTVAQYPFLGMIVTFLSVPVHLPSEEERQLDAAGFRLFRFTPVNGGLHLYSVHWFFKTR